MKKFFEQDIADFAANFPLADRLGNKVVAVTGATGLLGKAMIECLLALSQETKVVAVVRNLEKAKETFGEDRANLVFAEHDFASGAPFDCSQHIDYIVHLACPTASKYFVEHPVETGRTIVEGTQRMLEYARRNDVESMVYVSSLEVYGVVTDDSGLLDESKQGYVDPMESRSSYPMGKRMAECLCHAYSEEYGTHVKVARLAQTFGAGVPADDNRVFAQFARKVMHGENIVLHTKGDLAHNYCYTTDAVSGMLYVLLRGEDGEAYNVANEKTYISIKEMAEMLCREFAPELKPVVALRADMGYPPATKHRLDVAKLHGLGWKPRYDLKEMFCRMMGDMRG